jgi:rhodanese-related sulfurtransferase
MSVKTISPQQLHELVQSDEGITLIDVRTPVEYREVHVNFAQNVPLDQLNASAVTAGRSDSMMPLYVICRSGSRGKQACDRLQAAGFTNVVNVEGGTQAWDQAGLPVVRGKKAVSLERQVRILAGLMVVIGAVLSVLANPNWILLSGFVGAGLVFAGITDSCGMAMILARMPWNQIAGGKGTRTQEGSQKNPGRQSDLAYAQPGRPVG